jgi:CubicO group peptidase (beta-lactamase class C family)
MDELPPTEQRLKFAPVYSLLEKAIEDHVFPGCSFGVLSRGNLVALDAVGRQTYDPASPAIHPETVYDLASLTKVVATTSMAMLLHQRNQLNLDQPLVEILPEFQSGEGGASNRAAVTLRHLLAHNSGLAAYARLFETHSTPQGLFDACLHMPLEVAPGTRAEYSDIGFILLGRALEIVARESSLDEFCRTNVFDPLSMTSLCFKPTPEMRADIPPTEDDTLFRRRIIQGEVQDENCSVLGGVSGHAGLFGNALDLLRFSQSILDAYADEPHTLFAPETVRLFANRTGEPPDSSRALGWDTPSASSSAGSMFSTKTIGHLGYAGTSLWIDLRAQCAIVLLTNRTWPSRDNQAIRQLRPVFHNSVRQLLLSFRDSA